MKGPLNLANRPFRNETLPGLLLGIGGVLLVAGTVAHAAVLWSLMRGGRHHRDNEIRALEVQEEGLRREAASARKVHPDPATVAEWRIVKELVDRRSFSWTGLFSRLEETLPAGVRISSIAPSVQRGVISLAIGAIAESPAEGLEFLRRLQHHGDFTDVFPVSTAEAAAHENAQELHYSMQYAPSTRKAPSPEPAGASGDEGDLHP
jgi:Tfp pilus assembly protein PilN